MIENNTITKTSSFTYEDGRTFEVTDVHYHNDDINSWYRGRSGIFTLNHQIINRNNVVLSVWSQ